MRDEIEILPTTREHLLRLATTMRQADRDEIYAAEGKTPFQGLTDANKVSRDTFTATARGHVLCSFGVIPLTKVGGIASPWFLSSEYLPEHPRALLCYSRDAITHWRKEYDLLVNFVDARYTMSIRWLEKIGFTIHPAEPYGFLQLPFHMFEMRVK